MNETTERAGTWRRLPLAARILLCLLLNLAALAALAYVLLRARYRLESDWMPPILMDEAELYGISGLFFDPGPWLWLAGGAVLFSVLLWLILLRGITRSVRHMTQTTRQIAEGRFDVRVDARRGDELGSLADSINRMAARLNGFVLGQKRFLGDIAHELCSPLAKLQMALGIMEQRSGEDEYVRRAGEKAQQISALVNELLVFSRASYGSDAVKRAPVNVGAALREAAARESAEGVEVEPVDPGLRAWADEELLIRAVSNLIRNAVRHAGGAVTVSAHRDGENISIFVADRGPGVPERELSRLFDAFYRPDRSRARETGGVGLGLTIVKTCVESCGGTVAARNRAPGGLEVEIQLPASSR